MYISILIDWFRIEKDRWMYGVLFALCWAVLYIHLFVLKILQFISVGIHVSAKKPGKGFQENLDWKQPIL